MTEGVLAAVMQIADKNGVRASERSRALFLAT